MHSSAAGLPATRGGLTKRDGAISSPAWPYSLVPRGSGAEVRFIAPTSDFVTIEQVNSPVSSMKAIASFLPSEENITMCGRVETALK